MLREFQKEIEHLKKQLDNGELIVLCEVHVYGVWQCVMCAASGSDGDSEEEIEGATKKKKKSNKRRGTHTQVSITIN